MKKILMSVPNIGLIIIGIGLFTLFALQLTSGEPLFDFTAFWLAGKLTLEGQDPYLSEDWIPVYEPFNLGLTDNQTFLYPKSILPLFIPFSLLPLKQASVLWLVMTQIFVFISAMMLTRIWKEHTLRYILPLLISIFLTRGYQTTLALGQLGGIFLLIMTGAVLTWQKEKWLRGGVLLSMLALKPQLGLPIIALVSFWFFLKRRWSFLFGLAGGLLGLLLVGLAFDLNWVSKFLSIGGNKVSQTFGYHPTLWGLSSFLCQRQSACSYFWGGILLVGFLLLYLWLVLRLQNTLTTTQVAGLAIVFSLIVTPYIWVYDQLILLIPVVIAMGLLMEKNASFLTITLTPILASFFSLLLLPIAVRQRLDVWSALVPLAVLGILLFPIFLKDKPAIDT